MDCLDESSLEKLRLWPSDNDILKTIRLSYNLACELAEYVGMIQPIDVPVEINNRLNVIIESDDENSVSNKVNNNKESDVLVNDDTDISMAIQHASNQVKNLFENDNQDQNFVDSFNEGCSQLDLINQSKNSMSVINGDDSGKYFLVGFICNCYIR